MLLTDTQRFLDGDRETVKSTVEQFSLFFIASSLTFLEISS